MVVQLVRTPACHAGGRGFDPRPLRHLPVVVPSSFNSVTVEEFTELGVNVVIYVNQMLRAAYPSMLKAAELILENGRSVEAEEDCMSIKEILEMIPGTK